MAEILPLIGLGLAVPEVAAVLIHAGQYILSRLRENRETKAYASDLKIFFEKSDVQRLQLHIRQAQALLKDPNVDDIDKEQLLDIFEDIKSTIRSMNEYINTILSSGGRINRKRRVAREALQNCTIRCKELLGDFRDRVMTLRDLNATDSELVLKDHDFQWIVSDRPSTMVNYSTFVKMGRVSRETRGVVPEVRQFLYETLPYKPYNKEAEETHIQTVSRKLDAAVEGDPGILRILGFRDDAQREEFQMLFVIPAGEVVALAEFMRRLPDMPSLNRRVELCLQLAEAVLHVHNVHLVHKNIRPDNVAIFLSSNNGQVSTETLEESQLKLFLLGWQDTRTSDVYSTQRAGEEQWQRKIYQHPERQKRVAEADYNVGHDIYSLGVCILEILRWKPLVTQTSTDMEISADYARIFRSVNLGDDDVTSSPRVAGDNRMVRNPRHVQQVLLALGKEQLPKVAGKRLSDLVSDCLTLLDRETQSPEDGILHTEDQREIGGEFVDRILKIIREVSYAL